MHTSGERLDEERRAAVRRALGALTGIVPVGVIGVDPGGRVWYYSQRWQDLSGSGDALEHGRPWYDAVHPEDREEVAARWRSLTERRGRLGEFRAVGPDGSVRRCRADGVAMLGRDGELDGYLVVVFDADAAPRSGVPVGLATPHLLDAVLDRSSDIITILNADGSWRWSSGAAIRLVGHQEAFDAARGLLALLHPDDREPAQQHLAKALAGNLAPDARFVLRLRGADGEWRYMEALLDVLLDEPAIRGVVVHLHDITEHHKVLDALEASNRRLANLIFSMHRAVVLEDEDQTVVLANQAFVDLFRLPITPDELVGHSLESLGLSARRFVVEPPDADRLFQEIRASGERRDGIRCVLFDGRTIECELVPVTVQGASRGYLSAYRDVTRQALAEAERDRLLASEREENRRLAELDAYRSESIAAVSHELRTPLTSIVGYTQLLRSMLEPKASPDEVACLDAIVRNVDRLLRLAGDVVALDSLESRALPLPISAVDIPEIVRRAVRTISPEASEKAITVTVDAEDGPPVLGDEDRLAQLFENLLSNAVKFTLPEGNVTVRAAPVDGAWEVTIADSGIGIPEEELALLFTRFFRASNARRRGFPGSGLGLSVARAIAERHRGGLSIESVVGIGTTVTARVADVDDDDSTDAAIASAGGPAETGAGVKRKAQKRSAARRTASGVRGAVTTPARTRT